MDGWDHDVKVVIQYYVIGKTACHLSDFPSVLQTIVPFRLEKDLSMVVSDLQGKFFLKERAKTHSCLY